MTDPMGASQSAASLVAGRGPVPALVVLGSPRCGTTSLATWLEDAGLGVGVKDSFYLMDDDAGLRGPARLSTGGVPGYLDLFPQCPLPTVECSAGYLYQRRALAFFRSWEAPPQFAVVVRDPVERLRSVYRYFAGNLGLLPHTMTFADYTDALFANDVGLPDTTVSAALDQGCYAAALRPWVETFGTERLHIVRFDDLRARPAQVVNSLIEIAGGAPVGLGAYPFAPHNESYVPRSRLLTDLTALARRWVPAGKLRSWGGERVRRLQSVDERPAASVPLDPAEIAAGERLRDFYRGPNQELSRRFGVPTADWSGC